MTSRIQNPRRLETCWYALRRLSVLKAVRDRLLYPRLYEDWGARVRLARASPDNARIERVPDAGGSADGCLVMHNGIRVGVDSYYGEGNARLIRANRGVHEPQEELVFQEVLKHLEPGATMLELGAYWGFYSLWFTRAVPGARAYLVEPAEENLRAGRENFRLNGACGDFTRAIVGEVSRADCEPRQICVDDFVAEKGIAHLTVLHADIQGHEVAMLRGARRLFSERRVDYVFLSTHGFQLHLDCLRFLREHDFTLLASADKFESYSLDGLIAARRTEIDGCPPVAVSRR